MPFIFATTLEVISGLSVAAYAFGAMLGGDLVQRYRQRILFLACEAWVAAGGVLAAAAAGVVAFGAGQVLMGFSTGVLLIVALPPVVRRFPPEKMPVTTALINVGFGTTRLARPELSGWLKENRTALASPPFGASLRAFRE